MRLQLSVQIHSKPTELFRLTARLQECLERKAALDAAGPLSEAHDKKVSQPYFEFLAFLSKVPFPPSWTDSTFKRRSSVSALLSSHVNHGSVLSVWQKRYQRTFSGNVSPHLLDVLHCSLERISGSG